MLVSIKGVETLVSTHLAVEFRIVCYAPQCGRVTGGERPPSCRRILIIGLERTDAEPVGLARR